MIRALQDQTTLTSGVPQAWHDLQFHLVLDHITLHSLAAVVTAGCAILLFRTAAGTRESRFLKYLGVSIALNVVFRLGSVVVYLLKAGLVSLAARQEVSPGDQQLAIKATQAMGTLVSTWHGIDITISLLCSWFLIMAWHLLRRYPNEGVDRSLHSTLTALFGTGMLGVLSFLLDLAEKVKQNLWLMLDVMDVAGATIGLLLVGWQLQKSLGPRMKSQSRILRMTLPWMTTFVYFIWGGLQPFYPWLKEWSWYSNLLLIAGVSGIIMTVILCSQSLEEKPEYRSDSGAPPGAGATRLTVISPLQSGAAGRLSNARAS